MEEERWLAVPDFEGLDEGSDHGRVRRIGAWCDGRKRQPHILANVVKKSGYCGLMLFKNEAKHHLGVHRIVMSAFVGPIPFGHEVNHKNGRKADNRPENLEYVTHSANVTHKYRVLKLPHFKGSQSSMAKITEDEAIAIRVLRRHRWTLKEIAEEFELNQSSVCPITTNKAWTHF